MIKVRGGKREGAGRPAVGVTKKVSITLPEEVWEKIKIEKSEKSVSQSSLLRSIIEEHYTPEEEQKNHAFHEVDERAIMWWELARKNIYEGFIEIKKTRIHECIEHKRYSKELEHEVWERCVANSKAYKKPRVSYLLEAFYFEGERLLFDETYEDQEEQVIFAIIEYVRKNRKKAK